MLTDDVKAMDVQGDAAEAPKIFIERQPVDASAGTSANCVLPRT